MTDKELFDELDRRVNESKDSFISFVKSELESEYKNCKDMRGRFMLDRINGGILRCIYLFTMEEHSFYSSGDALDRIYRLLTNQHLIPITEDDFEDNDNIIIDGVKQIQCKRCPSIFRQEDEVTGKITYENINKYIFSKNGGVSWFGSGGRFGIDGLSNEISLPYTVPTIPEEVYLKEIPGGKYIRITDGKEIEEIRNEFLKEFSINPVEG